jgi:hypothetical protein
VAFEHTRGTAFLKAKLSAAAGVTTIVPATRHYERSRDPQVRSSLLPYIVITPISPRDLNALNSTANRILTTGIWDVKVVGKASDAALETLADAVDTALQATSGTAGTDGYVYGVVREMTTEFDEGKDGGGNRLRHIVGQYRLTVQIP